MGVAVFIVAALVYVTALERTRDFAVLKALGASSGMLFAGLVVQAVVVSLAAAAIAALVSNFMKGSSPNRSTSPPAPSWSCP